MFTQVQPKSPGIVFHPIVICSRLYYNSLNIYNIVLSIHEQMYTQHDCVLVCAYIYVDVYICICVSL